MDQSLYREIVVTGKITNKDQYEKIRDQLDNIYQYYYYGGFWPNLFQSILKILFVCILLLVSYGLVTFKWLTLQNMNDMQIVAFTDMFYRPSKLGNSKMFVLVSNIIICIIYGIYLLIIQGYRIHNLYYTRQIFHHKFNVHDWELRLITWRELLLRISYGNHNSVETLDKMFRLIVNYRRNYMHRFHRYKVVRHPRCFPPSNLFYRLLEIILFNDHSNLSTYSRIIGIIVICLLPIVSLSMVSYFIVLLSETYHSGNYGRKQWTPYAYQICGILDELPHERDYRMDLEGMEKVDKYLSLYNSQNLWIVSRYIKYVISSLLTFVALISIINENALTNIYFSDSRNLFYISGTLTFVYLILNNINKPIVRNPEDDLFAVQNLEHLSKTLNFKPLSTYGTQTMTHFQFYNWIKKFYKHKIILVLSEIYSLLCLPYIFIYVIPSQVNIITDYFTQNSYNPIGDIVNHLESENDMEIVEHILSINN